MKVVSSKSNPPKGASRLIYNVLAPSNAARGFPRRPFGTPLNQFAISTDIKTGSQCLRMVLYFGRVDAVSSASPGIHRWLSEFRQAQ